MLDNQGVSKLSSKQANLLSIMVALNAWEQNYSVPLKTQSGRSLYFQLAQALLAPDACDGVMMKQRVGDASERSLRAHMRSFEEAGLLTEKSGIQDARTRQIIPTEKFTEDLVEHLDHFMRLLESHYLLLEK
jgi:DNA-binding transcriptional ArsR family regulator